MPSPTEITISTLSRLIGTPRAPILIDVRTDEDFSTDPHILPTAIRYSFSDIARLASTLQHSHVVIYCQKGAKISQGAGAILRSLNVNCETLEGGHLAWRDAGHSLVPTSKLPKFNAENQTIWVTKHRPKIDRIACPWLIRRFIDRDAQFLFVSPSEVHHVAEKFNATPFDVDHAFWSHKGNRCTFDTMLEEFTLQTKALQCMATIVRGADTNRFELAPESAGLVALSLGLSRMYRDDVAQLDAGMMFYDALYRWARDARSEHHDSSTITKKRI